MERRTSHYLSSTCAKERLKMSSTTRVGMERQTSNYLCNRKVERELDHVLEVGHRRVNGSDCRALWAPFFLKLLIDCSSS